ncbi:AAA family ATPase [Thermoplasmatales archaeon AK]|nr:AAA family ATPase [Thermoplasmatales archaeon AK]
MASRSKVTQVHRAQRVVGSFTILIPSAILLYVMPFYPLEISILLIIAISALSFFYPKGGIAVLGVASILPLLNNFGLFGVLVWLVVLAGLASGASVGTNLPFILFSPFYWLSLPSLIGRAKSGLRNVLFYYVVYPLSIAALLGSSSVSLVVNTTGSSFKGTTIKQLTSANLYAFFHSLSFNSSVLTSLSSVLSDTTFYALVIDSAVAVGIAGYIIHRFRSRTDSASPLKGHVISSAVAIPACALGDFVFNIFAFYLFPVFGAKFSPDYISVLYAGAAGFVLTLLSRITTEQEKVPVLTEPPHQQGQPNVEREVRVEAVKPDVSWDSIFDMAEVKQKLLAIAEEISEEKKAYGLLLFGPPGTGKTMIAKGLAGKLNWRFVEFNTAEILSPWYGMAERNLETFFQKAQLLAPVVVFMDEIEGLMISRNAQEIQESTRRLINMFLTKIQDFHNKKVPVCFIGATNLPEEIDEALLRPGRFDEVVYVPLPDKEGRVAIWKGYLGSGSFDFNKLADKSQRFTPADIANIIQVVRRDAKRSKRSPTEADFIEALDNFKPSVSYSSLSRYEEISKKYSRQKMQSKDMYIPDVRWADVIGLDEVKKQIKEAIETPLKHKDLAEKLGIKPAKGILLYGPPGTGKTMLAKAVANELKTSFILVTGDELSKSGPYNVAGMIREKFNLARDNAPSVVFIDEIDMVARNRASSEWRNALTQMLTEMDGITSQSDVVVIGATNAPWDLDPAITRGGRLEKMLYVPLPDASERKLMFMRFLQGLAVPDEDLDWAVNSTDGYSPADIKLLSDEIRRSLFNEAVTTKQPRTKIGREDLAAALSKVGKTPNQDYINMYDQFSKGKSV